MTFWKEFKTSGRFLEKHCRGEVWSVIHLFLGAEFDVARCLRCFFPTEIKEKKSGRASQLLCNCKKPSEERLNPLGALKHCPICPSWEGSPRELEWHLRNQHDP